jgi:hypothetical protein
MAFYLLQYFNAVVTPDRGGDFGGRMYLLNNSLVLI